MKNYFITVIGGFLLIFGSIGISYGSGLIWRSFGSSVTKALAQAWPQATDGTIIKGLARGITYTANEEEDPITAAADTLPKVAANNTAITAQAYIVKDLDTGTVVAEHNSERLLPIASLTKLVTAAVAHNLIRPDEHIEITHDIMATFGNTAGFHTGEVFRAENIYYPLLMVSSNDAAEALALTYGRANFIKAMNQFAQSIGAYRTYFADPSGLSPQNESTAADMITIANWLRHNDPDIWDITMLKSKTIGSHTWINPTHFLNWSNYMGGKNGYIPESNRTGIAFFALHQNLPTKRVYAVSVLGSDFRDGDVLKLLAQVK